MGLKATITGLRRRVEKLSAGDDADVEFRVLIAGTPEWAEAHAAAEPFREPAEALAYLAVLGYPIAGDLVERWGILSPAAIIRRRGQHVSLGGYPEPEITTEAEAAATLILGGYRVELPAAFRDAAEIEAALERLRALGYRDAKPE